MKNQFYIHCVKFEIDYYSYKIDKSLQLIYPNILKLKNQRK